MPDRGYKYRKEWNAENYKQLNVALPPDLAAAFKAACGANNEPTRQVVARLVSEYAAMPPPRKRAAAAPDCSTRKTRRIAARSILDQLEELREAEEEYKDGIPESMYNRREEAENAVSALDDAIAAIEGLYEGD